MRTPIALIAVLLGLLVAHPSSAAEAPAPSRQQAAGYVLMGTGLTAQGATLTMTLTAIIYDAAVPSSQYRAWQLVGASTVSGSLSPLGVLGFELALAEQTGRGRRWARGVGFLQGGLYSLGMAAVLGGWMAGHAALAPDYDPTEGQGGSIVVPVGLALSYLTVSAIFTPLGIADLVASGRQARQARGRAPRVVPTISGGRDRISVGVTGVF